MMAVRGGDLPGAVRPIGTSMSGPRPRVTVSLVTWNGLRWLPGCLGALRAAADQLDGGRGAIELLVTDNGSRDGTVEALARELASFPVTRLRRLPCNQGYAAVHDDHLAVARGEAVLLLNQDLELDPGFLVAALASLDADPRVAAAYLGQH